MDLTKKYGHRDPKKDAIWVKFDEEEENTAEFLIAPVGNPKFKKQISDMKFDTLSEEERRDKVDDIVDLYLETILFDWKNLTEEGKEIKFTKENAKEIFIYFPDVFEFIQKHSLELGVQKYKLSIDNKKK